MMEGSKKRIKVIYILGYGRSGSTFFDILLNNIDGVTSIGAPSNFFYWVQHEQLCGCGAKLGECEFWGDVIAEYFTELKDFTPRELRRIQLKVERRLHYFTLLRSGLPDELLVRYARSQQLLYQLAARRAGTDVIVDSSNSGGESLGRAYALSRYAPELDVRVIHLVRDGRGVSWSTVKTIASPERTQWPLPKPMRAGKTALSWAVTNALCLLTASRVHPPVLTLRYEDLVAQPARELQRVGEFAEIDVSSLLRKIENQEDLEVGHNVGGNRVRFNRKLRIKPDLEWTQRMPRTTRWLVNAVSWPMLRRFGYPIAKRAAAR